MVQRESEGRVPVGQARDQWSQPRAQPVTVSALALTERRHHHGEATYLIVNIQRQRLARDWVAVAIVLHRNEVRIVSWQEGYGTRRIRGEELGKPPLKKIA
jgi:hypothetical protein